MGNVWVISIDDGECSFLSSDQEVAFHVTALLTAGSGSCINYETKESLPPLTVGSLDIEAFTKERFNNTLLGSVDNVRKGKRDELLSAFKSLAICPGDKRIDYENSLSSLDTIEEKIAYRRNWSAIHKNGGYKLMIIAADIIAGLEGEF